MQSPTVPVSWGELLDKIAILEIKRDRIHRPEALAHVKQEHRLLRRTGARVLRLAPIAALFAALKRVNEELWDIEDAIRAEEAGARFGRKFVRLARSVYQKNDRRAALKREINRLLDSELVEEKSYGEASWQPCVERQQPDAVSLDRERGERCGIAAERKDTVQAEPSRHDAADHVAMSDAKRRHGLGG